MPPPGLSGGCCCGAIRYETDAAPRDQTLCHCTLCRRTSGAPFLAWFTVPRASLRILQGAPARFASTREATRGFCARCGTQLFFEHAARPVEVDITTASLDDPAAVPPKDHTYAGSKLPWVHLGDGLPEYPQERRP
ncbi:MAG TPA: GFA family protein [Burkholderiales bacterium]|nr:GFA family protein [Burkholderiales bacterium]